MKILAVDGNSLAHRAFHAYAPRDGQVGMVNQKGEPVYAVYGFLSLLWKIAQRTKPQAILVGFDDHLQSRRKAQWAHYKAQRVSKGPELYTQMDKIRDALDALEILVHVEPGLEADDVMAAVAREGADLYHQVLIATSDRDSFALIRERVTVLRLLNGLDNMRFMTPEALEKEYGIRPERYLEYAALRGDPSDNLPGVKGVGEKTAARLVQAFPSMNYAFDHLEEVSDFLGAAVAKKLEAGKGNYSVNVEIMKAQSDFGVDFDKMPLSKGVQGRGQALLAHEMPSLVSKYNSLLS